MSSSAWTAQLGYSHKRVCVRACYLRSMRGGQFTDTYAADYKEPTLVPTRITSLDNPGNWNNLEETSLRLVFCSFASTYVKTWSLMSAFVLICLPASRYREAFLTIMPPSRPLSHFCALLRGDKTSIHVSTSTRGFTHAPQSLGVNSCFINLQRMGGNTKAGLWSLWKQWEREAAISSNHRGGSEMESRKQRRKNIQHETSSIRKKQLIYLSDGISLSVTFWDDSSWFSPVWLFIGAYFSSRDSLNL